MSYMDNDDFNPDQSLPDLKAIFRIKRGLLRRERIAVNVYALNGNGCVIKTDEAFVPGDEIRIAFSLKMPFENASTPPLLGRVRNVRKYCSNFFYRVDFTDYNKPSSYVGVARIMDLIERKLALTDRRKGGGRARGVAESVLGSSGPNGFKHAGSGGMS